ncbi:YqjF family protein [Mycobacterium sp. NPDC050041]|uniref:YqjF family protein n=1 Tax=Mycobacterium sp. NPDC050041 TaxID=3364293 RepID=UPI003C2AC936
MTFPVSAPALPRPVFFDQFWSELTFVHWPVDPRTVAHLYPAGTRPDVFDDGLTYVGLVPFVMRHTRVGAAVPLGYFGTFAETNVRLYSVDDAGRHGVLFRSLETQRAAVVPVTRIGLGVPYTWAKMRVVRSGRRLAYSSVRRWPRRGLRSALTVDIGGKVEPTPLEVWLTARWGAHTRKAGRTWWFPNEHVTWPLHDADVVTLDDDLVSAAGVTTAGEPLRALYSAGVHARFGRPTRVT